VTDDDEVARLVRENARLRQEQEARDAEIARLKRRIADLEQPPPPGPAVYRKARLNRFDCRTCGPEVAVDEDGCCRTCGRDAVAILGGQPYRKAIHPQPSPVGEEIQALYDIARDVSHEHGASWTDPRTGVTYPPPPGPLKG